MNEVKKIRDNLFRQIKKLKIQDLVSVSLVGSFQYANKIESVSDVDLVIIVKELTPIVFNQINSEFNDLAKMLSSKSTKYIVENRIGPFKPKASKYYKIMQLHLIILDVDILKSISMKASTLDWIKFNILIFGKKLSTLAGKNRLTKEAFLRDLEVCLSNLVSKTTYTKFFKIQDDKIILDKKQIKLSDEEYNEGIVYNIIISFLNYIRYFKPSTVKDKEVMLSQTKKLLPEHYKLLKKSFEIKDNLKNSKKVSKKELESLKQEGKEFIEELINRIKST